jgi:hypothetical protein
MSKQNFTTVFLVDQRPEDVFKAVNNVRGWWTGFYSEEIKGDTEKLNDEFIFRAGPGVHYSKQKLVEVIPNEKVVWLITDSKLSFLKKKDEWTGTKIVFEISKKDNKTQVRFTHEGLIPKIECYEDCSSAWSLYLNERLFKLITGKESEKKEVEAKIKG